MAVKTGRYSRRPKRPREWSLVRLLSHASPIEAKRLLGRYRRQYWFIPCVVLE